MGAVNCNWSAATLKSAGVGHEFTSTSDTKMPAQLGLLRLLLFI